MRRCVFVSFCVQPMRGVVPSACQSADACSCTKSFSPFTASAGVMRLPPLSRSMRMIAVVAHAQLLHVGQADATRGASRCVPPGHGVRLPSWHKSNRRKPGRAARMSVRREDADVGRHHRHRRSTPSQSQDTDMFRSTFTIRRPGCRSGRLTDFVDSVDTLHQLLHGDAPTWLSGTFRRGVDPCLVRRGRRHSRCRCSCCFRRSRPCVCPLKWVSTTRES